MQKSKNCLESNQLLVIDSNKYEEIPVNTRVYDSWTFGTRALIIDYWTPIIYNDYKFIIWR